MRTFLKMAAGLFVLGVLGVTVGITPVVAHHSAAMFDRSKVMTIKGVVKEVRWVNPHASVTVNGTTKDGEEAGDWVFEMTSPGNLMRTSGWQRDSIQTGDHVEATFNPLRNVENRGGSLRTISIVGSGKTYTNNLLNQEQPDLQ